MTSTPSSTRPLSGGKENQHRMRTHIRLVAMLGVVAAFAVLAAGCGSKSSSSNNTSTTASSGNNNTSGSAKSVVGSGTYDNGSSAKGGNYRIGWEQSFGFTNNFDPTGEYLGNAWGLYSNLMLRSLVGYT